MTKERAPTEAHSSGSGAVQGGSGLEAWGSGLGFRVYIPLFFPFGPHPETQNTPPLLSPSRL